MNEDNFRPNQNGYRITIEWLSEEFGDSMTRRTADEFMMALAHAMHSEFHDVPSALHELSQVIATITEQQGGYNGVRDLIPEAQEFIAAASKYKQAQELAWGRG